MTYLFQKPKLNPSEAYKSAVCLPPPKIQERAIKSDFGKQTQRLTPALTMETPPLSLAEPMGLVSLHDTQTPHSCAALKEPSAGCDSDRNSAFIDGVLVISGWW